MARLLPSKKKIIFDSGDWMGGLHPAYGPSATSTPIPEGDLNKLTFSSKFNPYRNLGYATPGFNPSALTNNSVVNNTPIRNITMAAESATVFGYGIDSNERVFQLSSVTCALTNAGVWPHTIVAAGTAQGSDVTAYNANIATVRKQCVFYSYNNSGADTWNVGCYTLDGSTFVDDFMSTNPDTPLVATDDINPHP